MKCESKPLSLRLISLALSLCLLFGLMPVTVFAEEEEETNAVKIGPFSFPADQLNDAIEALDDGEEVTVTLLDDVSDVVIPEEKVVIIDLNGHTISSKKDHAITNNGTLTVTDNSADASGKVDGGSTASKGALYNAPGATATLEGGTFTGSKWYVIKNLGTMTISGASVVQNDIGSSAIDNGYYGNTANDCGVTYPSSATVSLTITSGSVTGGINCVKNDDFGVLEITGGEFYTTASNGACIQNWNVATISGGTFVSDGAVAVISNGYLAGGADEGILTITGGDFTATNDGNLFGTGSSTSGATTSITGGTFDGTLTDYWYSDESVVTIIISGGTFSANVQEEYLDDDLETVPNDDGTYTVVDPDAQDDDPVNPSEAVPEEKDDNTGLIVGALAVGAIAITALTWKYLPVHQAMGSIQDKDWNGLPGATVTLLRDGKAVRTVVTNEGGGYEVYVPKGTYTLEVSYTVPETGEVVTASTEISVPTSNYSGDVVLNW